jgi:hypothetical protein
MLYYKSVPGSRVQGSGFWVYPPYKEKKSMHRIMKVLVLVIFVILFSALISPVKADKRDLFCYLEATTVDVIVVVWEEDRQGNKGPQIWQGIVKTGHRQRINTRTGGIRLSSSIYIDTNNALSGDTSRWCEEGSTVGVP